MRAIRSTRSVRSSLPIVDAVGFLNNTDSPHLAKKASQELLAVAQTTGFFYLRHNIPSQVIADTRQQLKSFFDLPLQEKSRIHVTKQIGFRGYSGMYEQGSYGVDPTDKRYQTGDRTFADSMDHKEVFHMGPESPGPGFRSSDMLELFAPNVFPLAPTSAHAKFDPEAFRAVLTTYYNSVHALSNKVFKLFAHGLNLSPNYFDNLTQYGMDSMNCIWYPSLPDPGRSQKQMGINPHTDFECFTVLWQQPDGPTSLEILTDDSTWVPVAPIDGTFVINIGDLFARWTGDKFRSTVHRSRTNSSRDRMAIAFFRGCNFGVDLECLIPNPPKAYPLVRAGDHMLARVRGANTTTIGQRATNK
eukprot:c1375_g1_i1.p1 GENE.c1375_g1_i1~~c1375_g1_i1.p1  ORF type:complete len:374 (+),score=62.39 c1375_g1_i1:47-1123(+)